MTIIETIRQLVSAMEPATAKDEALKIGVLAILEKAASRTEKRKKNNLSLRRKPREDVSRSI